MPMNSYSVRLKQVVEEFNLIVARESSDYDHIDLMVEEVMRPGLPLAGFFTHFEPLRLQVIGNAEATYLHSLTPERRAETFDQLFSYHIPALVFARNIEPMPECMQMAEKHDIKVNKLKHKARYHHPALSGIHVLCRLQSHHLPQERAGPAHHAPRCVR